MLYYYSDIKVSQNKMTKKKLQKLTHLKKRTTVKVIYLVYSQPPLCLVEDIQTTQSREAGTDRWTVQLLILAYQQISC